MQRVPIRYGPCALYPLGDPYPHRLDGQRGTGHLCPHTGQKAPATFCHPQATKGASKGLGGIGFRAKGKVSPYFSYSKKKSACKILHAQNFYRSQKSPPTLPFALTRFRLDQPQTYGHRPTPPATPAPHTARPFGSGPLREGRRLPCGEAWKLPACGFRWEP